MPAHWCVELGLGHLVGGAVSRSVFRGGCVLRKSLSSLSVDGWDCVPAQLVVWLRRASPGACRLLGGVRSWC